jgi:hypothetical protein
MIRLPKAKSVAITTLGVNIGKNTFHLVGLDKRGAIVLASGCREPKSRFASPTWPPASSTTLRRETQACPCTEAIAGPSRLGYPGITRDYPGDRGLSQEPALLRLSSRSKSTWRS